MRTLKNLILFIFVAVTANVTSAQGFGIRAGANFSDINFSEDINSDVKTGLYIGVFKEIPLVKKLLFIQPELQYSQEGFETNTDNVEIDYLSVPIMAKVYVLKVLSFETGPQFGFPISDNLEVFDTESFVTSWGFGMNINLPLHLSLNARYVAGLTDAIDGIDTNKSQVIQVGAGIRF
jgi:hypothetical protein